MALRRMSIQLGGLEERRDSEELEVRTTFINFGIRIYTSNLKRVEIVHVSTTERHGAPVIL